MDPSSSSPPPGATTLYEFLPALQFASMLLYPQPSYSNSESQFSHIRSDVTLCPPILLTAIGLHFLILYPFSQSAQSILCLMVATRPVRSTHSPLCPGIKTGTVFSHISLCVTDS